MDAVDWTGLTALAAIFLGGLAWLRNQLHREIDALRDVVREDIRGIDARLDRLDERYVRHLEAHATGTAP